MLQLFSSTAGVRVKFFSVKISLMKYNFLLIFFIDFNNVGEALYSFSPQFAIHIPSTH